MTCASPPPTLALVTGASRGIGAATARALCAAGTHVLATDIDLQGLEETAAAVRAAGGTIDTCRMDVCDTGSVDQSVSAAARTYGRGFDVLVNNAGYATVATLDEITDEHWAHTVNLNLMSMMRVARAVVPGMRERGGGHIICLGSIAGYTSGWPGRLAYSSAKAGVAGFVKSLAMELAPQAIRVNGVAPAGLHASADQVPLGRVGTPDDIGAFIGLLTSPHAAFMTGQMISVDGGMSVAL
ncbi:SDR family NAD(P)-dependent oxidoreductase [Luteimonas composti]|uniref:SDR family NAD(P)-dependent oxidoreductase n=1 Tax=Luteimonas composti TaxID=398257 RepID=A0ABT6MNQ1_9GAMM|nr:SDR family NAD(P)-dependent oxidoreductase [Luteimonas composti]MDH7452222.1 SDR family NAD(P)-dependent oxidoreductase [Luteimonas composti]